MPSVLLVGAALFIGSFISLLRVDPGIDTRNVLSVQITPPVTPGSFTPGPNVVLSQIVDRLRQERGVVFAAVIFGGLPLRGGNMSGVLQIAGRPATNDRVNMRLVSDDYHRVLGIPLKRGRLLDGRDRQDSPPVALINEFAARRYFGADDPLGQAISVQGNRAIVGIVGDVHQSGLETDPLPEVYLPLSQFPLGKGYAEVIVRGNGRPSALLPAVKSAVFAVLPHVPVRNVTTLDELYGRQIAQRRLTMLLVGLFGLLALVISAVGIYGVMAFVVSERTREIGIRMALGATRMEVMGMILGKACVLVAAGLAIGAVGAWYMSAAAKAFLFKLDPTDPRAFLAAVVVLSVAGLAASVVPARRAAGVSPVVSLRAE